MIDSEMQCSSLFADSENIHNQNILPFIFLPHYGKTATEP